MEHLENHPYAFIKDNVVQNVYLFADHNQELVDLICTEQDYDTSVSCCEFGVANLNDTWDGTNFTTPVKETPSE